MQPSHQRKIEKLAKHIDAKQSEIPDSELLVSLIDIEDKLDALFEKKEEEIIVELKII